MDRTGNREKLDIHKYVGPVLATGVLLSLIVLLWGALLYLTHGPHHAVAAAPMKPGSILVILRGVVQLDPTSTINLGLLILLITPVARIIAALIAFAIEGDRRYVLISLAVLAILALSALLGH